MSETVRSFGLIAILRNPLSKEEREALTEKLWETNSPFQVNYEGTLVYSDLAKNTPAREEIHFLDFGHHSAVDDFVPFFTGLKDAEIAVETLPAPLPYMCVWHTGSDCSLDLLTKAEYLAGKVG